MTLAAHRAARERELCRWLLAAERLGVHVRAGYADLREYAERTLGLRGRQTEERLRVGRALQGLPQLDEAFAEGRVCWSAVRELTRVSVPETEGRWLEWSGERTIREVERAVAARVPGEGPDDPGDPSLVKHRLVFEVRAETKALFRDLEATIRSEFGGPVDADTVLLEIARRALGGPVDEGRASYQVAVVRCDVCDQTSIDASGQTFPVAKEVGEMISCDTQYVGRVDGNDDAARETQPDGDGCCPPDEGLGSSAERPHVGARRPRASQRVPPAIRRRVKRRDRNRCMVPGCEHHRWLDIHHLDARAHGGGHDPERLVLLCAAHHRAVHSGRLFIDGSESSGFSVCHSDGTPYGGKLSVQRRE